MFSVFSRYTFGREIYLHSHLIQERHTCDLCMSRKRRFLASGVELITRPVLDLDGFVECQRPQVYEVRLFGFFMRYTRQSSYG
jgi:hypothetical protein